MDLELRGRVAIVTGGASGIGAACAAALASEGALVAVLDRNAPAGEAVAERLRQRHGARAIFLTADVTSEDDMRSAVARVVGEFGGIDVVVGAAGISGPFGKDITEIEAADFDAVLAVNVRGPFLLAKHTADHLARAEHPAMVLIASDSSFVAAPGMVPYNASKGAVLQLTRALSVDLAGRGIRVNCVCPSVVNTPMARADLGVADFADADFPVQSADQVAAHVLYLASPVSAPVNGTSLVSDFGYLARSSFPA